MSNHYQPFAVRERLFEGPFGANLRELPASPLYLYLTYPEWCEAWINGGSVPLSLASKYLSSERTGVKTPDEVHQVRWDGANQSQLAGLIGIEGSARDIRFINCSLNGRVIPDTRIDIFQEDALILCLSTKRSKDIQDRLNKSCCVEIAEFDSLLMAVKDQFGDRMLYGPVRYTTSEERSHFMKSQADSWMQEYRIAIPSASSDMNLILPQGIGKPIAI